MSSNDPFTRERRLLEVGDAGLARISNAEYRISSGDSSPLEFCYLSRAGATRLEVDASLPREPFAHNRVFRHDAARVVAEGAWGALGKLRQTLGLKST